MDKGKQNKFIIFEKTLIKFIIAFCLLISAKENGHINDNYSSEITIKIKGNGTQQIIAKSGDCVKNFEFIDIPNEIYVNGQRQNSIDYYVYNLKNDENNITMIWNHPLNNTNIMFSNLENITEFNFSNFDASEITSMQCMFENCYGIEFLNLSNFKTSKVQNMRGLFSHCKNLQSIDLTNFDTSSVIDMFELFKDCKRLKSLDLSSFNTSKVTNMGGMFKRCEDLISLDLSNFKTSLVKEMNNMFQNCTNLVSLDLNNFDTSSLTNMYYMFDDCENLASLDINKLDTNKVQNMEGMFSECKSLKSLDLSSLNTSSVTNMNSMFKNCKNLNILIINTFNTSNVKNMGQMFYGCELLESLDLSSFDTSSVTKMNSMFKNCKNLTSVLNSFDTSNVENMEGMFYDCKNLASLISDKFNTSKVVNMEGMFHGCESFRSLNINFDTSSVTNMNLMFKNCKNLISLNLNNLNSSNVKGMSSMFQGCQSLEFLNINNLDTSLVTDMNSMFRDCLQLTSLYLNNFNFSQLENCDDMFTNSNGNLRICIEENKINEFTTQLLYRKEYYEKICFISCSNNGIDSSNKECIHYIPEGYYFNSSQKIIDKCEDKCRNCKEEANNNNNNIINKCLECKEGYEFKNETNDSICHKKCDNYYYFDINMNYFCTDENVCPSGYKLILDKKKCISNCSNDYIYKYEYNNLCYESCPTNTNISLSNKYLCQFIKKECKSIDFLNNRCNLTDKDDKNNINSSIKDAMVNNIINDIEKGNLDSLIDNIISGEKKDYIIKDNDTSFQITSSENQNKKSSNMSTLILGECENILKDKYKINQNLSLIIFKIDYYKPGSLIPIIGYEIFHPENKSKLDLNFCKNESINFNLPVLSIDEDNLYKYDPNNEYYTNECYPSTTDDGVDIILNDRHSEYNNNNLSLCQNNCTFQEYEKDSKNAICQCLASSKDLIISELINQTNSYDFSNKDGSSSMITMKCVSTLFTKKGLSKNIISYILIFIIILTISSALIFYKCGYSFLLEDIKDSIIIKNKGATDNQQSKKTILKSKEVKVKKNVTKKSKNNYKKKNNKSKKK